jgi:leader peptidase (prepilin peptidase)/N-methyltransferase
VEYQIFIEILAAVFGLVLGSFANVCICRLPEDESVVTPRSHCRDCLHPIAWYDNLPLLSFALLGGRCRHCHAAIGWRYPAVEALTGVWFWFMVHQLQLSWDAAKWCLCGFLLIELICSDLESRILPDEFTLGGWVAALALSLFVVPPGERIVSLLLDLQEPRWIGLAESGVASAALGGVLWLVGWLYMKFRKRDGLGLGDVKLLGMMSAFLGLQYSIGTLLGASLSGSVLGYAYIKLRRLDPATYELPLGTFLGVAGLVAALVAVLHPAAR